MTSHADARLVVNRWVGTYLTPANHPDPEGLRRQLDEAVRSRVAELCRRNLSFAMDSSDPSVWRVRELKVNLAFDAGLAGSENVAGAWGEKFVSRIQQLLEQGEDDAVLRFPDRAAYIAQFVLDLCRDRAWGKWYYEEFESLSSLPTNRAIREVMLRDDEGAAVLLKIRSLGRLEEMLTAIHERDAEELLEAFALRNGSQNVGDERVWAGRLLGIWGQALLRPANDSASRFRDGLRLILRVDKEFPGAHQDASAHAALAGLLELREKLLGARSPMSIDRMVREAIAASFDTNAVPAYPESERGLDAAWQFLNRMAEGDEHWAQQAAAVLLGDKLREETLRSQGETLGEPLMSQFAGVFLLGPALVAIGLSELTERMSHAGDEPCEMAEVLRHLAILKCVGRARNADAAEDPAVRLLSGFQGRWFHEALARMNFDRVQLECVEEVISRFSGYGGGDLLVETFATAAFPSGLLLIRDLFRDEWLALRGAGEEPDLVRFVAEEVRLLQENGGEAPRVIFVRGDFCSETSRLERLTSIRTKMAPADMNSSDEVAELCRSSGLTKDRSARALRSAENELQYFSGSYVRPEEPLTVAVDLALTLLARAAMKSFARSLMGLESSSPEHLYNNVLAGTGTIRSGKEKIEVELPTSPLAILLRLGGLQEQKFRVPWLGDKEICLAPPRE